MRQEKLTAADEKRKPLTNVVRDSEKAVPQSVGSDSTPTSHSDPVATVDKPTKDEPKETAHDAPAQSGTTSRDQGASSGTDAEAGKS